MPNGSVNARSHALSAVELVSLGGYSFLIAWIFVTFFWLFRDFPPAVPIAVRDLGQLAVFAGMPLGYAVLHFLGRSARFNLFSSVTLSVEIVCAILLPIASFAMIHGTVLPFWAVCVVNVLAGAAAAALMVSWLDVLSRLKTDRYGRFTGLAFAIGALLFALATFMPDDAIPVISFAYVMFSIGLVVFATQNADGNEMAAPLEGTRNNWTFTKEIEPSLLVFGMVFAMNFVFLFNVGSDVLFFGMMAIIPGALVTVILATREHRLDITVVQRFLLVIAVLTCVLLPFSPYPVQIGCAFLAVAAWATFKSVNYAFIVRKSVVVRLAPFFRQAPSRLFVSSVGFAIGWAVASVVTVLYGANAEEFAAVRLAMAFLLVLVVMVFFPVSKHHPADGTAQNEEANGATLSVSMDESELFDARCDAIVKLYKLSPRESDVFRYLARGRNAVWIQQELVVSPHTVKSHIYNIYRKLDIHSQQKLMTFVEEYPLDADAVAAQREG